MSKVYTAQEMRDVAQCLHYNSPTKLTIEAAAMLRQAVEAIEREAAKDVEIANLRVAACGAYYKESHMSEDMDAKDAEIARLRAALKPVLECDCWILETAKSRATDGAADAIKAVKEAQRIYNESEVK